MISFIGLHFQNLDVRCLALPKQGSRVVCSLVDVLSTTTLSYVTIKFPVMTTCSQLTLCLILSKNNKRHSHCMWLIDWDMTHMIEIHLYVKWRPPFVTLTIINHQAPVRIGASVGMVTPVRLRCQNHGYYWVLMAWRLYEQRLVESPGHLHPVLSF